MYSKKIFFNKVLFIQIFTLFLMSGCCSTKTRQPRSHFFPENSFYVYGKKITYQGKSLTTKHNTFNNIALSLLQQHMPSVLMPDGQGHPIIVELTKASFEAFNQTHDVANNAFQCRFEVTFFFPQYIQDTDVQDQSPEKNPLHYYQLKTMAHHEIHLPKKTKNYQEGQTIAIDLMLKEITRALLDFFQSAEGVYFISQRT